MPRKILQLSVVLALGIAELRQYHEQNMFYGHEVNK